MVFNISAPHADTNESFQACFFNCVIKSSSIPKFTNSVLTIHDVGNEKSIKIIEINFNKQTAFGRTVYSPYQLNQNLTATEPRVLDKKW